MSASPPSPHPPHPLTPSASKALGRYAVSQRLPALVLQDQCSASLRRDKQAGGEEAELPKDRQMSEAGFEPGVMSPKSRALPVPTPNCPAAAPATCPMRLHPSTEGLSTKSTWRRSRERARHLARARARGPAPPAKMFPLRVIDRLECRETKLFMR